MLTGMIISTFAGTGTSSYSGDNGLATSAGLNPYGVAVDSSSNIYIADYINNRIRKVTTITNAPTNAPTKLPTVIPSTPSFAPTYMPSKVPTKAPSMTPTSGATASSQDIITTIAGTGTTETSGDGGAATSAGVYYPPGVAVDSSGNYLNFFFFLNKFIYSLLS